MNRFLIIAFAMILSSCNSKPNLIPSVSFGTIVRIDNLASKYVDTRNIDVWLPPNYSTEKKYAVLYMHDGQMLFDSAITWNKKEWKVDEVLSALIAENAVKECIVVGIWNNGDYRHAEYFPQKTLDFLSDNDRKKYTTTNPKGKPQADSYLKFIVDELKPYIDLKFSTHTDASNTYIMGSSMGGLISLYAVCEYPRIFGGAGCVSTHWPLLGVTNEGPNEKIFQAFKEYLKANLPIETKNRIYFDYGTETLDSHYKPYQILVDEIMHSKGYNETNWVTLEFSGEEHSEVSWSKRLDVPLKFLLK